MADAPDHWDPKWLILWLAGRVIVWWHPIRIFRPKYAVTYLDDQGVRQVLWFRHRKYAFKAARLLIEGGY